jgi:MHS family proline/betaine transporter-like MFS transporter
MQRIWESASRETGDGRRPRPDAIGIAAHAPSSGSASSLSNPEADGQESPQASSMLRTDGPNAPRPGALAATIVGNVLEWFDFGSYAFLAALVARNFFPAGDNVAALMSVFAAFGAGFVTRPLGAIVFGRLGDTRGRKAALILAMPLMALGTIVVGATPSFSSIGATAPILLVVGRLLQGFAAGGEPGSAMTFLVEWAPPRRRAFFSSLQQCSTILGLLVGSGFAALLTSALAPTDMARWGWRVPFLVGGLLIAPLGLVLRSGIDETPEFGERRQEARVGPAISTRAATAKAVGLSAAWVVSFYVYLAYLPTFLPRYSALSALDALWVNTAGLAVMMCCIPCAGWLSDRIGRRPPLMVASVAATLVAYPVFLVLTHSTTTGTALAVIVAIGALLSLFAGIVPATMAEQFPASIRTTGISVSYGLVTAVFGGFAPYASAWAIKTTGSPTSPAIFLVIAGLLSTLAALGLRETAFEQLR